VRGLAIDVMVEIIYPLKSNDVTLRKQKHHIATQFASGDTMADVFMDVLDYQLTPEELLELKADTDNNGDGDTSPGDQNDFAAAFVDT
jgi:hypothetical protein